MINVSHRKGANITIDCFSPLIMTKYNKSFFTLHKTGFGEIVPTDLLKVI